MSPALVAIGVAVGIVALLGVLYLWVIPKKTAQRAAAPTPELQNAGTARTQHPLAKHLELMGVRIREAKAGTAQVQFVVVNHSGADLPEMKMDVTLRAADRTILSFPTSVPSLGPYEYKELNASVKTDLKPYELPDWQMIRPEFQVTTEP